MSNLLPANTNNGMQETPKCVSAHPNSGDHQNHTISGDVTATSNGWQTTQLDRTIGERFGVEPNTSAHSHNYNATMATASERRRIRRKNKIIPSVRVFCGTFVHSTEDNPMKILKNWMIGVDKGKIVFSSSVENYDQLLMDYKVTDFEMECVSVLREGTFMMPGFVNAHTQAVPYISAGLIQRTNDERDEQDRRGRKVNLLADDKIANEVLRKFVDLSISNGITCAAYSGSAAEFAVRRLTDIIVRLKQRALVGLELGCGDCRDDTHILQIVKARDVVEHVIRKKNPKVQPYVVLSQPLPSWLEKKIAELLTEFNVQIKIVIDKSLNELNQQYGGWVDFGKSQTALHYHSLNDLFTDKSILVHCTSTSRGDVLTMNKHGVGVVHCPSADIQNGSFKSLTRFAKLQIPVGLGTDLVSSHSLSMCETIRKCAQAENLRLKWPKTLDNPIQPEPTLNEDEEEDEWEPVDGLVEDDCSDQHSIQDFFQMATLGGAQVLKLDDKIGNFQIGKEFDAILIDPYIPDSSFVALMSHDTIEDTVEKFLCMGSDRNIVQVYIGGERVK